LGICTAHIVSSIHQTVRINVIIFEQDPAKYYPSAAPQDDLSKSIKSATASPWVDSIAHRSFTQDDWSVQIILHIALSIERRGGILARAILEMAAQHRKKETRRRGWLRSAVAPEGMRVRQERGYLVGAIGLLLAEPLDLLLEPPDLLLHVHGASDCRTADQSRSPGSGPCPCARVSSWILSLSRQLVWQDISDAEEGLRCVTACVANRRTWTV